MLDTGQKNLLHRGLGPSAREDEFVDGVACDDVMNEHGARMPGLNLSRRANALADLLKLLQVPPMREKAQDVPAILQVEPVTG